MSGWQREAAGKRTIAKIIRPSIRLLAAGKKHASEAKVVLSIRCGIAGDESPAYPFCGSERAMGAFAVLHPRYRPFVTNRFTRDFCDC